MLAEACPSGYFGQIGDVDGWGSVDGRGGGEVVSSCNQCASICDSKVDCMSFECSGSERKCNLNSQRDPTHGSFFDFMFCTKGNLSYPTRCRLVTFSWTTTHHHSYCCFLWCLFYDYCYLLFYLPPPSLLLLTASNTCAISRTCIYTAHADDRFAQTHREAMP